MIRKFSWSVCVLCVLLLLTACGNDDEANTEIPPEATRRTAVEYKKISAGEAKQMMDDNPDVIVLDVRALEEFTEKRIGGAVLLPHTGIEAEAPGVLPDKSAAILVYCRTGGRSKAAADILIQLGYTNVYDIGGIENWPYDTASGGEGTVDDTPDALAGGVVITFDYEKQPGSASNQFAVWIEDMEGRLIKTLYATHYIPE